MKWKIFVGKFLVEETSPNCARKVCERILFNVLCTVYCGRGCLSLESEGKENERLREFLARTTDNGQRDTRGVLRGPRGPKKSAENIKKKVPIKIKRKTQKFYNDLKSTNTVYE